MRVKVDEDLPRDITQMLRDCGVDAVRVVEQGMSGWEDSALWQVIHAEERLLITADKEFLDSQKFSVMHGRVNPKHSA